MTIADLEYYWTANHEDLQLDPIATDLGKTDVPAVPDFADEHGTAVFGEMVAKDNGYGVTGGVPDATMRGISPTRARPQGGTTYNTAAALTYVGQFLTPGDVVLVEQQTAGPAGGTAYVPIEWTQANFDAIKGSRRARHHRHGDRRQRRPGPRLGADARPLRPRRARLRRDHRRRRSARPPAPR